jgi:hypothetical protein
MKQNFAVKSHFASVYMAFIQECEAIGWIWNSQFNKKENVHKHTNGGGSCIYFSTGWTDMDKTLKGRPAMSFSGWNGEIIDLDKNFAVAVETAKEVYKSLVVVIKPAIVMQLTKDYLAQIYNGEIVVGCQHIPFGMFDKLAAAVAEYRADVSGAKI